MKLCRCLLEPAVIALLTNKPLHRLHLITRIYESIIESSLLRKHTKHTMFICKSIRFLGTHLHPQPCQLQAKGFSPVCLLRWAFRWLLLVYILVQPGKEHLCILMRSATVFFWNFCPPTRIPDAWLVELSPSPRGLAAIGTGAIRTNFEETLRLGEGRMWGTRAKV